MTNMLSLPAADCTHAVRQPTCELQYYNSSLQAVACLAYIVAAPAASHTPHQRRQIMLMVANAWKWLQYIFPVCSHALLETKGGTLCEQSQTL